MKSINNSNNNSKNNINKGNTSSKSNSNMGNNNIINITSFKMNNTNNLFNEIKNEAYKNKALNKNFNKPPTVMNIRKTYKNTEKSPIIQNNIAILSKTELNDPKSYKRLLTNKNTVSPDAKSLNVNFFNSTTNSLTQSVQTISGKLNSKKKPYSTNQKNNKIFLKHNLYNSGNSVSYRTHGGIRKEETRSIENMINNLNSYVPKNDYNIDENNIFGIKKMK